MGLVWDMECPAEWNGHQFKPSHKYVLVCYADHADHNGGSIYPAIATIHHKTGYEPRNVQYLTHDLQTMGILIADGQGPRGTNKWRLSYDATGTKIQPVQMIRGANFAPLQTLQGAKDDQSLGAKPSGAKFAPESTEQDIYISILENNFRFCDFWKKLEREIQNATFEIDGKHMIITGLGNRAAVLQDRYKNYIKRALVISKDLDSVVFME